jgi:hypothetical protein
MSDSAWTYQRHLASALLAAGLSQTGYIKAVTIMSLEDVLKALENDSGERRNPEKYHVCMPSYSNRLMVCMRSAVCLLVLAGLVRLCLSRAIERQRTISGN